MCGISEACVDVPGGHRCQRCPEGLASKGGGDTECGVEVDPCEGVSCGEGASCEDGVCRCDEGLDGDPAEACVDLCEEVSCGEGARCVSGGCECEEGLVGNPDTACEPGCALAGACAETERCVDGELGFECEPCAEGMLSEGGGSTECLVDIDECAAEGEQRLCDSQRRCVNTVGGYECQALLEDLDLSVGIFVFDPDSFENQVEAELVDTTVTLTPNAVEGATVLVNGVAVESGKSSEHVSLDYGDNSIEVVVTLGDTTLTYVVVVTRPTRPSVREYLKSPNVDSGDLFGSALALSGNTLVVGVPEEDGGASSTLERPNDSSADAGAVYVFTRGETGGWVPQAYLKASNAGASDNFGAALALDGDTLVVGAPGEDGSRSSSAQNPNNRLLNSGAAYVFVRSAEGVWTQQAYLKAPNAGLGDNFGRSVAVRGDFVLVGAPDESGNASSTLESSNDWSLNAGAAYVFRRAEGSWTIDGYLKASNAGSLDAFGSAVALGENLALVGASGEDGNEYSTQSDPNNLSLDSGAAYFFVRSAEGVWTQQSYLKSATAPGSGAFGAALALEGSRALIAAPKEQVSWSVQAGAAYVFDRQMTTWHPSARLTALVPDAGDQFGSSVALEGDTLVVTKTAAGRPAPTLRTTPRPTPAPPMSSSATSSAGPSAATSRG